MSLAPSSSTTLSIHEQKTWAVGASDLVVVEMGRVVVATVVLAGWVVVVRGVGLAVELAGWVGRVVGSSVVERVGLAEASGDSLVVVWAERVAKVDRVAVKVEVDWAAVRTVERVAAGLTAVEARAVARAVVPEEAVRAAAAAVEMVVALTAVVVPAAGRVAAETAVALVAVRVAGLRAAEPRVALRAALAAAVQEAAAPAVVATGLQR